MPANAALELVRDFVNTLEIDEDLDHIATVEATAAWLEKNGLPSDDVSEEGAAWIRTVREAIRELLKANNGMPLDPKALEILDEATRRAPLRVAFSERGEARLEPTARGADAAIGRILAAIERAQAEGNWQRIKACHADDCFWAFVDESRNRSRTWCSMAVCGNRAKARSYRERN